MSTQGSFLLRQLSPGIRPYAPGPWSKRQNKSGITRGDFMLPDAAQKSMDFSINTRGLQPH